MKNLITRILLAASVLVAALCLYQVFKTRDAQTTADTLRAQVTNLQGNLEAQKQSATQLQNQLEEARADTLAKAQEAAEVRAALKQAPPPAMPVQPAQTAAAGPGTTNAKPSNPLAEMFKNPEMKEMIKKQQKAVLGPMMEKNYAKLFADLHLNQDQAGTLKDMLLNKQLGAADMGLSMLSGDSDPEKRAEMMKQVKEASDAADARIKEFLGDDGYTQFQSYEKTVPDRMAVSNFKDQLSGGVSPLSGDQEQQLIDALTQERQNFKFTTDFNDQSKMAADPASMLTEERIETLFKEMGTLNEQYISRAQGILSQEQLASFEQYLRNQQSLQKAGMQMATKLFAPAKPGGN